MKLILPRSPITMMPSSSAGASAAASTRLTVGCDRHAATSRASRVRSGRRETRARTSVLSSSGTGNGAPTASGPVRSSSRAISTAYIGFPPLAPAILTTNGRANERPSSRLITSCRAAVESGPSGSSRRSSIGSDCSKVAGLWPSTRTDTRMRTGSRSRRRTAKESASAVASSSHWASSTATSRLSFAARSRSTDSRAVATTRPGWPEVALSLRRSAASRASRCTIGSAPKTSGETGCNRSVSPLKESRASVPVGCAVKTR